MKAALQKLFLVLTIFCLGVGFLILAFPERLQIYGKIHVGQSLPSDLRFIFDDSKKEASAQFYSFYFRKHIQPFSNYSIAEKAVASRGGRLFVIDDKIAPFFDIPYVHNGVEYQLVDSLLITVADDGKVLSIHRSFRIPHFILGFGMPDRFGRGVDKVRYAVNKIFVNYHAP